MKLAIVGSRRYRDFFAFCKIVSKFVVYLKVTHIVSGGCRGPDNMAEDYAKSTNISFSKHMPNWDLHGKAAGYIRNKKIVEDCDAVLAFWDGKSKGTKHTIDLAKAADKDVYIVNY